MKKIVLNASRIVCTGICVLLFSCNKNNGLVDAEYPDGGLYLAQAAVATVGPNANGIYTITSNIEGQPQRFKIDVAGGKMNIPLGIIKSGISTSGTYAVTINANTDTITKFIAAGKFAILADPAITTELLPSTAFTLPASVDIADGSTNAGFILSVNTSFLINSLNLTPKKRYAIGVTISNSSKSTLVKPLLSTAIILINPAQVILPVANFSTYIYKETKTGNFANLSANAASYSWDFGDGTPASTLASTDHIYAASGTYSITLTTTGITGSGAPSVKTTNIVIP